MRFHTGQRSDRPDSMTAASSQTLPWRSGSGRGLTSARRRTQTERRGAVTLELLLTTPVLVILLMAVCEFGLIFTGIKQVAAASRLGAKFAAETGSDVNLIAAVNSGALRTAIDRQLAAAGATSGACQIVVQYDSGGGLQTLTNQPVLNPCLCTPSAFVPPTSLTYVRVTVGVRLTEFSPDLLSPFGFSITNRIIDHSTTYRLE